MSKKRKEKKQVSPESKVEISQTFVKTYADVENRLAKFFHWGSALLDRI